MRPGDTDPVPLSRAFARDDPTALRSQAAALLLIRTHARGAPLGPPSARARGRRRGAGGIPSGDLRALSVPPVHVPHRRTREDSVVAALRQRYGRRAAFLPAGRPSAPGGRRRPSRRARVDQSAAPPAGPARSATPELLADLARRLSRRRSYAAACELTRACLHHPYDLPRVAAAAAHFELSASPTPALPILTDGLASTDPLARAVAVTALAQITPEAPSLQGFLAPGPRPRGRPPSATSLLVHGTFARTSAWWQPGGDFHEYLGTEVRGDLYGAADRFEWSGGWSDGARAVGAADLEAWVTGHELDGLDLFTHSHGGSVAMLASHHGLGVGELVMLSCPVHTDRYLPDFDHVKRTVSVRVHLDLVILVDGGGQRFTDSRIEEHVLPIWFDHFATHDPAVWRDHNVPGLI